MMDYNLLGLGIKYLCIVDLGYNFAIVLLP